LGSTLIVTQPTSNQSLVVAREYINDAHCFGLAAKCTMPFRMRADGPTDEREARKRRRLEAFRRVPTRVKASLHPVQVEGKGWALLDVGTEEVSELLEELRSSTMGKRRGGKKWRRGGPGRVVARRGPSERKQSLRARARRCPT
jgi:hypothetical protein